MFMQDVIHVEVLPERRLRLRFSDQREGVVDMDTIVGSYTGVFAPMLDAEYFAQAAVDPELGTVVWPNGADVCPDVLYAHATGQAPNWVAPAEMHKYLRPSEHIDFNDGAVRAKAAALATGLHGDRAIAEACFKFVRDEIRHSWDYRSNPVTCKASDVLRHSTGYCYAKSHLLAALLRANGIPAGLCYQRLSVGDAGAPYCLHGLNAVFLKDHGWYRCDARGNKAGVDAKFSPPHEVLAFPIREPEEGDIPGVWAKPLLEVIDVLTRYTDVADVHANLPDVAMQKFSTGDSKL